MAAVDQCEDAMRTAFEDRYQRGWNDPSGDEIKAVWSLAWTDAQAPAKALLTEALDHITPKPWDDMTLLHARVSEFVGQPVEYPDLVAAARVDLPVTGLPRVARAPRSPGENTER